MIMIFASGDALHAVSMVVRMFKYHRCDGMGCGNGSMTDCYAEILSPGGFALIALTGLCSPTFWGFG